MGLISAHWAALLDPKSVDSESAKTMVYESAVCFKEKQTKSMKKMNSLKKKIPGIPAVGSTVVNGCDEFQRLWWEGGKNSSG